MCQPRSGPCWTPGRTPPPVAPEGGIPPSQNSPPLPSGASCFVPHPPICCLYVKGHTLTCPEQVSGLGLRTENSELFLQAPLRDGYSANLPATECVESGCGERGGRGLTWLLGWSSVDAGSHRCFLWLGGTYFPLLISHWEYGSQCRTISESEVAQSCRTLWPHGL